jgi:hypothetical protein
VLIYSKNIKAFNDKNVTIDLSADDKKYLEKLDALEVLKIVYQSFQICIHAKGVETLFDNHDLLKGLHSVVPKPLENKKFVPDPHGDDDDDHSNSDDGKTSNTQRNPPPKRWSDTELILIFGGIALVGIGITFVLRKKKSATLPV